MTAAARSTRSVALASILLAAFAARAEFWDGNQLLDRLASTSNHQRMLALGYIMGVSDTMQGANHCPPENVTAGQLQDMVTNYLNNVPAQRHKTADTIVLQVLRGAFPCTNSRSGRNS